MYFDDYNHNTTATNIVNATLKKSKLSGDDIVGGIKAYAKVYNIDIERFGDNDLLNLYKKFSDDGKREIKIRSISNYSFKSTSEAISEAFSDWYANGINANSLSREIIKRFKGIF